MFQEISELTRVKDVVLWQAWKKESERMKESDTPRLPPFRPTTQLGVEIGHLLVASCPAAKSFALDAIHPRD